ncbi:MAG: cupin domain-containing protein [Rhodospirillaceae bacterium]|nr:cupin domain-containing protein [Rhodospirillaceae bacterium]MYJ72422.1 cupin domain-containing protein [Rhodospirillaceae bacterium]
MEEPRIVRGPEAEVHPLHGEGKIKRLIYPQTVGSQKLFVGIAEVGPGEAPHVFHRHGVERVGNLELTYAEDFEEFYFVVEGSALMQWREADGAGHEVPVSAGDAIYMPVGAAEHRIFNNGTGTLRVLYGGTPPAAIRRLSDEA